ncbi:hypothetical protein LEP1GSC048_3257 [Leptospira santarosai serovar Shermani str. 1342KT]|nr:hypothetical protein LEP1GSC048_3257 [Leptospira santarosai serovar Shermani str. 1342KT]
MFKGTLLSSVVDVSIKRSYSFQSLHFPNRIPSIHLHYKTSSLLWIHPTSVRTHNELFILH